MSYTFHVYILRCADDSLYVGHTDDIEKRLSEHELGIYDGYTKLRRPVHMVYSEEYPSRDEAFHRERQIKSWSRAKKEALIRGDYRSLVHLSMERTGLRRLRFDDWATDTGAPREVVLPFGFRSGQASAQDERA